MNLNDPSTCFVDGFVRTSHAEGVKEGLMSHMHPKRFFIVLGAMLWFGVLVGMSALQAQHFTMRSYDEASGLSNLNVRDIIQDSKSRVWVGTESGVFLANGGRFEKQLSFERAGAEFVRALRVDAADRLWALDARELFVCVDGKVSNVSGLSLNLTSTSNDDIVALPGDRDGVYLLRDGRLQRIYTLDGGKTWLVRSVVIPAMLEQFPILTHLSQIAPAGHNAVWAASGRSLLKIEVSRQIVTQVAIGVGTSDFTSIYGGRDSRLWARSNREIGFLDELGHLRKIDVPGSRELDVKNPVIAEDAQGRILFNLAKGIGRLSGEKIETWNASNGLPAQELDSFAVLASGDLWMGPSGHGIARWLGYGQWEAWTEAEGMSSSVIWPMAADGKRRLWIAGEHGVDRLDPQQRSILAVAKGLPAHRSSALIVDHRDHVWIGYSGGQLFELNTATGKVREVAESLGRIMKLLQDDSGTIWVCSESGLYRITAADNWRGAALVGPGEIPTGYAWYIAKGRKSDVWLCNGTGLHHYKGGRWQNIQLPFPGGKEHNFMVAVAADGTLWAQGQAPNALMHLAVIGDKASIITEAKPYLGSSNITFIDVDSRGLLWVGSDAGISVFNGRRWVQRSTEDGLIWNDTDFHAFYEDKEGTAWIGTSGGLSHMLDPTRLFSVAPPEVKVEHADLSGRSLGPNEDPIVDVRRPTLDVKMLNTDYGRQSSIVYRFRLEGLEEGWQTADSGIHYASLPPGAYNLSIVAQDERQGVASEPTTISFKVLPPWWGRTWFICLEICGLGVFLLVCWRGSIQILVHRQEQLEKMVEQRTSELVREKNELSAARSELIHASRTDALTGLLTRPAIFQETRQLCEDALNKGTHFAYAMADLDAFKQINDTFGHIAGDQVLRTCATRIAAILRPGECAGRYGGEEFFILLPGLNESEAYKRLEEIRCAIAAEPIALETSKLAVTCSFGLACFRNLDASVEVLIHSADLALYRAKQRGRNRVERFSDRERSAERLALAH